jgi:hypothetical protein
VQKTFWGQKLREADNKLLNKNELLEKGLLVKTNWKGLGVEKPFRPQLCWVNPVVWVLIWQVYFLQVDQVLGTRQEQHSPVFSLQDPLQGGHEVAFLGSAPSDLSAVSTLRIGAVPSWLPCGPSHGPTREVNLGGLSALEPLLHGGPEALGNPFCPDLHTLKAWRHEISS